MKKRIEIILEDAGITTRSEGADLEEQVPTLWMVLAGLIRQTIPEERMMKYLSLSWDAFVEEILGEAGTEERLEGHMFGLMGLLAKSERANTPELVHQMCGELADTLEQMILNYRAAWQAAEEQKKEAAEK